MRFAIDARPAFELRPTGVGHYTRRILEYLPHACPSEAVLAWHLAGGASGLTHSPAPNLSERVFRVPGALERVWRGLDAPALERLVAFDALLATNYLPPPTRSDGVVLVVHDLAFEVFPETGPAFSDRWRRRFDRWLRRSAAVIVPSRSAARDLLERHRLDERHVHVIPHGADRFDPPSADRVERTRKRFAIGGPYALFVGGIEPRKNLGRLVRGFATVGDRSGEPEPWLVIAGGGTRWAPNGEETLAAHVEALPEAVRRRVVRTGYVSEEDRHALLAGATALVYPSRYEGFGFPVLEAFAAGVPVLTSTASSLPEVAGDGALLVDPDDVGAIGEGLHRMFEDAELRARLVEAGRARLPGFTWEAAARVTAQVLRDAAGRSARSR